MNKKYLASAAPPAKKERPKMGNLREAKPVLPRFGNLGAHQEPFAGAN